MTNGMLGRNISTRACLFHVMSSMFLAGTSMAGATVSVMQV